MATESTDFEQPQYILIESEPTLVCAWRIAAENKGIKIAAFNSVLDFHKVKHKFNKDIPIYINYQHGKLNGVTCAKELYDYGFTNIYLQTGYSKEHIEKEEKDISWLKGIIGKALPFLVGPESK